MWALKSSFKTTGRLIAICFFASDAIHGKKNSDHPIMRGRYRIATTANSNDRFINSEVKFANSAKKVNAD